MDKKKPLFRIFKRSNNYEYYVGGCYYKYEFGFRDLRPYDLPYWYFRDYSRLEAVYSLERKKRIY